MKFIFIITAIGSFFLPLIVYLMTFAAGEGADLTFFMILLYILNFLLLLICIWKNKIILIITLLFQLLLAFLMYLDFNWEGAGLPPAYLFNLEKMLSLSLIFGHLVIAIIIGWTIYYLIKK